MFCGCKSTYYVDYPVEIRATSDLEQKIPRKLETVTDQDPINTESLRFQAHSQTHPTLYFRAQDVQHKLRETHYCLLQVNN